MDKTRNYDILARSLAIVGGLVFLTVVGLYLLQPGILRNTVLTEVCGGLGALTGLYYVSLHQILKSKIRGVSTIVIASLSLANLGLLMYQTGGVDSPFFSLFLLAIVLAGILGLAGILVTASLGSLYVGSTFISGTPSGIHALQLAMIVVAASLGLWLFGRRSADGAAMPISSGEGGLKAEALISNLADGVMVVDRNLKIGLFNPAAQQLTGWDLASAQGLVYRSVMPLKTADGQDVNDQTDPFIETWNKNAPVVRNNLSVLTRSGRKVELSLSISPVHDAQGQISGAIGVFRDISQEKQIERQRNEFISTASHEMRTPVAAIEGYISLAMNPKVATVDDRARGFLDKAHQNTQHLGELFRDLLGITKLEDGQMGKNLSTVDLGKLVQDVVSDMQFSAANKKLSLTFTSSGGEMSGGHSVTPLYAVQAEPERLREVVMNLIENALKFTSVGGITVRVLGDNDTAHVSISDTGVGIAAEDIPHLFQKFYRVDNSATRTIGGTGLGLYLCRSIIELFNGRMWVESTLGKGSTFHFTLPRVKNAVIPVAPIPAATAPAGTPANTPAGTAVASPTSAAPVPQPAAAPNPAPAVQAIPVAAAANTKPIPPAATASNKPPAAIINGPLATPKP